MKNNNQNKYIKLSVLFIILIIISSFFVKDVIFTKDNSDNSFAILLNVGETFSLNNEERSFNWLSSDEEIAVVDGDGNVTAKATGIVVITAHENEQLIYEYTIKIVNDDVSIFDMIDKEVILQVNSSYKLELKIEPETYDVTKLIWNSSDENIVKVENGVIKGLKEGSSTVKVTAPNGLSSICKVIVENDIKLESVEFTEDYKKIYIGERYQTKIKTVPEKINLVLTYKSSNEKIATVSNNGLITGISEGKAEIIGTVQGINTKLNIEVIKNKSKTITVNFDSNGADKIGTSKEKCKSDGTGCKITLPSITRTNYNIIGWSKNKNSSVAEYKPGDKITVYSDNTYYAITSKEIKASFKANGATMSDKVETCSIYNKETSCTVMTPSIVRDKYNIIGWGNSSNSKTKEVNANTSIILTENKEFYAVTSRTITATFNKNGANVIETSKNCSIYNTNSSCSVTTPDINRSGYNIVGWGDNASSTTKRYNVKESIVLKDDITYYAITYRTLTATFNANKASISKDKASCNVYNLDSSCNVETPSISRANYTTLGWALSYDAQSVIAGSDSKIAITAPGTYYAITKISSDGIETGCTGWMSVNSYYYESASTSSLRNNIAAGTAFTIEGVEGSFFKVSIPNVSGYKYVEYKYVMINLSDYIPSMIFEITNASSSIYKSSGYNLEGVTGTKLYSTGKVYNLRLRKNEYMVPIQYTVAKKLLVAQRNLQSQGYSIKVYDTYRPHSVTTKIYSSLNNLYNNNSIVRDNILYSYGESGTRYTWGKSWFLASSVSTHNTGAAIDMSLVNKSTGIEVTMPTAMHELSTKAIKYYSPSVSRIPSNYSKEMNEPAKIMDNAATAAGLTTLSSEWWHFQDNEAYNLIKSIQSSGCNFSVTNVYSY